MMVRDADQVVMTDAMDVLYALASIGPHACSCASVMSVCCVWTDNRNENSIWDTCSKPLRKLHVGKYCKKITYIHSGSLKVYLSVEK